MKTAVLVGALLESHLFQKELLTGHEPRAGTARGHSCPQRRANVPRRGWFAAGWKARAPEGGRFMESIDGKRVTAHGNHEPRAGTARGHSCPQRRSKIPWRAWLAAGWKARAPDDDRFMEGWTVREPRVGTMNRAGGRRALGAPRAGDDGAAPSSRAAGSWVRGQNGRAHRRLGPRRR